MIDDTTANVRIIVDDVAASVELFQPAVPA